MFLPCLSLLYEDVSMTDVNLPERSIRFLCFPPRESLLVPWSHVDERGVQGSSPCWSFFLPLPTSPVAPGSLPCHLAVQQPRKINLRPKYFPLLRPVVRRSESEAVPPQTMAPPPSEPLRWETLLIRCDSNGNVLWTSRCVRGGLGSPQIIILARTGR